MKLATIRRANETSAVRIDGDEAVEIPGVNDLGQLLAQANWRAVAESAFGARHDVASADFDVLVPKPDKVVCVGLNYRDHVLEMGGEVPERPTLFAKFRAALIGAHDDVTIDVAVEQFDWEAELAVIIGAPARRVSEADAGSVIAGYSVLNDGSARDWQNRTSQFLQGKTFEGSTPIGPWMVTADEFAGTTGEIACAVNGETMQRSDISELIFGPHALVAYISSIITLLPGDIIATGTPGGTGVARKPPRFLRDGDVVTTTIAGIGECSNRCRRS